MAKEITFSFTHESTLKRIDEYAHINGISRSAVIALLLDSTAPLLNEMVNHYHAADEIKSTLLAACQLVSTQAIRLKPEMSKEDHYTKIWRAYILYPLTIIELGFSRCKANTSSMGLSEREEIRSDLQGYIDKYNLRKAIYVYKDRRVNHSCHAPWGDANTILIKETTFGGFIYDFSAIVTLPSDELNFFGIDEVLKRNNIYPEHPYICWIPIYHTNNKTVMIPVIHQDNAPASAKKNSDAIIINPFGEEEVN
jgi:hypothetical protein